MRHGARRRATREQETENRSQKTEEAHAEPSFSSVRQKTATRSIDNALDEPLAGAPFAEDPVRSAVGKRHVPFIAVPHVTRSVVTLPCVEPPLARRAPGTGTRLDPTAGQLAPIRQHTGRLSALGLHARDDWNAEAAKRGHQITRP